MALSGVSITKIAQNLREKGIPTSKKTVGKVLSDSGYLYDKQNHEWIRSGTYSFRLKKSSQRKFKRILFKNLACKKIDVLMFY